MFPRFLKVLHVLGQLLVVCRHPEFDTPWGLDVFLFFRDPEVLGDVVLQQVQDVLVLW